MDILRLYCCLTTLTWSGKDSLKIQNFSISSCCKELRKLLALYKSCIIIIIIIDVIIPLYMKYIETGAPEFRDYKSCVGQIAELTTLLYMFYHNMIHGGLVPIQSTL